MSDFSVPIEWCNLSSQPDGFLTSAFDELCAQLLSNYPTLPGLRFTKLPSTWLDRLPDYLIAMLPGNVSDPSYAHYQARRIFVFCDGRENFARAYQAENALAHWGVAIPCTLAIAWEPNKHLVWHESLHLLNAKDCYNKFGINRCSDLQCLMRRDPSRFNHRDPITLCSKNIKRIHRFAANVCFDRCQWW